MDFEFYPRITRGANGVRFGIHSDMNVLYVQAFTREIYRDEN